LNGLSPLYDYDTIPLSTYIEIAKTGNLYLLLKNIEEKELPPFEELSEHWEKIVETNSIKSGSLEYQNYKDDVLSIHELLSQHVYIHAHIMRLLFVVDDDSIKYLNERGYRIDTKSASAYNKSILICLNRARNLKTKLETKEKQILEESKKEVEEQQSIEQLLASISAALGFNIPENILLARFNEYHKIASAKNKKKHGRTE
jgi:hypothetical protein